MKKKTEKTILVVEDDDDLRLTLREYLQGIGYNTLVAADGVSAIKHLLDTEIDLIVSDYRMDVFGGDYWVRFLKRYCGNTKVILTSGFLQEGDGLPFTLLEKPFDYSSLGALVSGILSGSDEQD